jgi:hypothetical protein
MGTKCLAIRRAPGPPPEHPRVSLGKTVSRARFRTVLRADVPCDQPRKGSGTKGRLKRLLGGPSRRAADEGIFVDRKPAQGRRARRAGAVRQTVSRTVESDVEQKASSEHPSRLTLPDCSTDRPGSTRSRKHGPPEGKGTACRQPVEKGDSEAPSLWAIPGTDGCNHCVGGLSKGLWSGGAPHLRKPEGSTKGGHSPTCEHSALSVPPLGKRAERGGRGGPPRRCPFKGPPEDRPRRARN